MEQDQIVIRGNEHVTCMGPSAPDKIVQMVGIDMVKNHGVSINAAPIHGNDIGNRGIHRFIIVHGLLWNPFVLPPNGIQHSPELFFGIVFIGGSIFIKIIKSVNGIACIDASQAFVIKKHLINESVGRFDGFEPGTDVVKTGRMLYLVACFKNTFTGHLHYISIK